MRYILFFSLSILFIIMAISQNSSRYPSDVESIVDSILAKTAKTVEKKYPLQLCGTGAAMPGGIVEKFNLAFTTKDTLDEKRLRELLVSISNILLENINGNDEMEKFLVEKPFTTKNVLIIIYNHGHSGRSSFDPNVTISQISRGILTYTTNESEQNFVCKKEFTETFEEAQKLVKFDSRK